MTPPGPDTPTPASPGGDLAERLERGELIHYPVCPFPLPDADARAFLSAQDLAGPFHKNISFDPATAKVHGHARCSAGRSDRLRELLSGFSATLSRWLASQLPHYARQWTPDRVSFRPLEEATRNLRLNARNDLIHVDAFPTRPTHGWRILRVFANVNEREPRVWVTSEPFARLLPRYGASAGLPSRHFTPYRLWGLLRDVPRQLFRGGRPRSEYDAFMLRFHDFLKSNEDVQERSLKRLWTFAPGSAWMAMTDACSHAELRGRHALEHSFFVAPATLALPAEAPAALLSKACGFEVIPGFPVEADDSPTKRPPLRVSA